MAAELCHDELTTSRRRLSELRDLLHRHLQKEFGPAAVRLNEHPAYRLPNTLNVSIDGSGGRRWATCIAASFL